jgi:hypothetical protein
MNVYEDMARDAGATGDEVQQMAQAIEADHRAQFEGGGMTLDEIADRVRYMDDTPEDRELLIRAVRQLGAERNPSGEAVGGRAQEATKVGRSV